MTKLEQIEVPSDWTVPAVWPWLAQRVAAALSSQSLALRDAVVLLPFAALLAPLRAAFAAQGGWLPRVETALTLAAGLAPPVAPVPGMFCGDHVLDTLNGANLLRGQTWCATWSQEDPARFEHCVGLLVQATQTLVAAGAAVEPGRRQAWWQQVRLATLPPSAGTEAAAMEARLLAVAVEWAAGSCTDVGTDALYAFKPSAWVLVTLGGSEPLSEAVVGASNAPCLQVRMDPVQLDEAALRPSADVEAAQCWVCDDFEAEAQAAATLVIEAVNGGQTPVGLVAVDRALIRRIRALLDRQGLPQLDETGWLLATTPSAAHVLAVLRAALALELASAGPALGAPSFPAPGRDAVLNWLKSLPSGASDDSAGAGTDALEALWRGRRGGIDRERAAQRWHWVVQMLAPLRQVGQPSLASWLRALHLVLQASKALPLLHAHASGRQVLQALHLDGPDSGAWAAAVQATRFTLSGFVAWAVQTLEQSPYLPLPDEGAQLVLTPLARAYGRSFGHIIVPGADHQQLGRPGSAPGLISQSLARRLGLPDFDEMHRKQRLALQHLLRGSRLSFTRRQRNGLEPVAESTDLTWLRHVQSCRDGRRLVAPQIWQGRRRVVLANPVLAPAASVAGFLPTQLSPTQLEALRICPYKFFARVVLQLNDDEELDGDMPKRDYGNWLHEVLYRFHCQRDYRQAAGPQLQAAAEAVLKDEALDADEMVPWLASFAHFGPAYLRWLAEREAQGWFWADGETEHSLPAELLMGTRLHGRLDRVDHGPQGQRQVIDYKTASTKNLKGRVVEPLEDTQLACYAALLSPPDHALEEPGELMATYLAVDNREGVELVAHPDVGHSANVLLQALPLEWQRLREGEPLLALGDGPVCEYCEARGLCRRDQWHHPVSPLQPRHE